MNPGEVAQATRDFLYALLRATWEPQALHTARAPADTIDWRAFLHAAQEGGVAPLLYPLLRGQDLVPPSVVEHLRQVYYASAARSLPLFQELRRVLQELAQAEIPAIVLKGAALAPTLYGNVALRPLTDLDLLLRPADVAAALRALQPLGYVRDTPELRPGFAEAFHHHVHLRASSAPAAILELHWTVLPPPCAQTPRAMDWFWESARPVAIDGISALVLGPEAQLLHLCAHLAQHQELDTPRLLWLHDIAGLCFRHRDTLDWELVVHQAEQLGLGYPLARALERVALDWQAPVPETVRRRLGQAYRTQILWGKPRTAAIGFLRHLAVLPGWRRRIAYALGVLFPVPEYMRQRYRIRSPFLLPFAYPYRWLSALHRSCLPSPANRSPGDSRLLAARMLAGQTAPGSSASEPGQVQG